MRTGATEGHAARLAFVGVMVAAALVLVYENREMWFGGDEWFVLTDRGVGAGAGRQGALEPFNEHWTTIPILAFRALYSIFGLHSYWPYVALVIVAHLGAVVMLWVLMLRARIDAWVALSAVAVFAVLGIGSENLLTAWQVTLVASLALGLAALVVAPTSGPLGWRDAVAAALLLAALASSGVGLPLAGVFALVSFVRRGWRVTAAILAVPVLAYGLWFAAYGRDAERIADPAPGEVPAFVWHGLADAFGDLTRIEVLGPLVVVATAGWLVVRLVRRPWDPDLLVPGALVLGAVAFLATTGYRRANLPGADAAVSRYAYVTIGLVLPLVAMAAQPLFRGDTGRRVALGVVTVVLVVAQVRVLDHAAERAEPGKRSDRGAMLAAAALAREGRTFVFERPLHPFEPQVTVDEIVAMDRDGKLPRRTGATRRDRLTVLARLNLALGSDPVVTPPAGTTVTLGPTRGVRVAPSSQPGCVEVDAARADNEITLRPSGPATVRLRGDGVTRMWLRDEERGIDGEAVAGTLDPADDRVLSMADIDGAVVVALPRGTGTVLCGVG